MKPTRPTYQELATRLATVEPIIEALKHHEVDAVVGQERLAFLLLNEVREEMVNSEAGFRAIFDLSGVGMFQADAPAFQFTRVNQKFCEITGYPAAELLTKTYIGLTDPLDRKKAMQSLAKVIRGQVDSWTLERRYVRKDGGVVWLSSHGAALRDEAGRVVRIMAMIGDITGHKQAEQALRERSEQLRKLAAELTRAERRERQRIAGILHDHIEELLQGATRRKAPLKPSLEKTVRQALQDVQDFIDQAVAPPVAERTSAAGRKSHRGKSALRKPKQREVGH